MAACLRACLLLAFVALAAASKGHSVHHLSEKTFAESTADGKVGGRVWSGMGQISPAGGASTYGGRGPRPCGRRIAPSAGRGVVHRRRRLRAGRRHCGWWLVPTRL